MTFYLRVTEDGLRTPIALYEATAEAVRMWRDGAWHPSPRTKAEVDGLGGASDFFPIPDTDVEKWKKAFGGSTTMEEGETDQAKAKALFWERMRQRNGQEWVETHDAFLQAQWEFAMEMGMLDPETDSG